ncbi:hypothetical protein KAI12_00575 [Candidatus Bathyarchaeota archaeon]|nr:hypothetical protein [Candidatus Bathyarchaeota archaeon]
MKNNWKVLPFHSNSKVSGCIKYDSRTGKENAKSGKSLIKAFLLLLMNSRIFIILGYKP